MFGLSIGEVIVIGIVALLVFGPEKLPDIARTVGKVTGELKRTSDAVRKEFYNNIYPPLPPQSTPNMEKRYLRTEEAGSGNSSDQKGSVAESTANLETSSVNEVGEKKDE